MSKLHLGLSLVFALLATGSAHADMGLPGFKPPKSVHNRITTREDLKDSAFLIVRHKFSFDQKTQVRIREDQAEYVEFSHDKPIFVSGHRRDFVELYMIPRSDVHQKPAAEVLEDIKGNRTSVIFKSQLSFDESVPEWSGDELTIEHRFQRASAGGGFELVRTSWEKGWECCAVGLALPIAFILGGIWVIRNLKRRMPPPPASPQAPDSAPSS